jgi:hypothetical protein
MEEKNMKPASFIRTGVLLLLLGSVPPTYAQEEKHEQETKPEKQEQAKPAKEEKQAKPANQEPQAKPQKQEQAKPAKEEKQAKPETQAKSEKQEQPKPAKEEKQAKTPQKQEKTQQHEQAQGQWARNGQKDSRGHEYNESRFGREHHARFEENGGRFYNGRREYSYGGYWFYAGAYPAWFYQQDVYFIMGADGLWYAVAYGDPSLTFQVDID